MSSKGWSTGVVVMAAMVILATGLYRISTSPGGVAGGDGPWAWGVVTRREESGVQDFTPRDHLPVVDLGGNDVLVFPVPKSVTQGGARVDKSTTTQRPGSNRTALPWAVPPETTLSFASLGVRVDTTALSGSWRDEAQMLLETLMPTMTALNPSTKIATLINCIQVVEVPTKRTRNEEGFELAVVSAFPGSAVGPVAATVVVRVSGMAGLYPATAALFQLGTSPARVRMPLTITDYPDVPWRGLMVDVARHFIPMELLFRTIDAMWLSRLNTLHLHLTDSQAFPLLLEDVTVDGEVLPLSQLAVHGALAHDKQYSARDMHALVAHAASRGIEVVPEIDLPAHAASWGGAFPTLVVQCKETAEKVGARVALDTYLLDPSNPLALRVARAVIAQVADMFPSQYLHVGADELVLACWRDTPHIVEWAAAQDTHPSMTDVLRDFETEVFHAVRAAGKVPMVWQGLLDEGALPVEQGLSPGAGTAVVEPWKCWSRLAGRAAQQSYHQGLRVMTAACLYLDWSHTDLASYLAAAPVTEAATDTNAPTQAGLRLGGEVALFTENSDASNYECRLWPRTGAAAAALWHGVDGSARASALTTNGTGAVVAAYIHFRYCLRALGVAAAPITLHYKKPTSRVLLPSSTPQQWTVGDEVASLQQALIGPFLAPLANSKGEPHVDAAMQPTSQCPVIPIDLQRPMGGRALGGADSFTAIAQLNVADGGGGSDGRENLMHSWLRSKATDGVSIVGLCEMNGWHDFPKQQQHDNDPYQSPLPATKNFPRLRELGSQTGFPYWHILHSETHPYNIGLLAADEFEVKGTFGPASTPPMQRGLLWVYFPRRALHVMVVHLHAHSSSQSTREADFVTSLVGPLTRAGARVVVMGDMNTLSPWDRKVHEEQGLAVLLDKAGQPWTRLHSKFCVEATNSNSGGGSTGSRGACEIDYAPMQSLLSCGLQDSCRVACLHRASDSAHARGLRVSAASADVDVKDWSPTGTDEVSVCMQSQCLLSEPTKFDPEWPASQGPAPAVRLDFVLVSDAIVSGTSNLTSFIERTNVTDVLSDHYPALLKWDNPP